MAAQLDSNLILSFNEFAQKADYSLLNTLKSDPEATQDGVDHQMREVFSGHFVLVTPTPIPHPEYISHSKTLFHELGLSDDLPLDEGFRKVFSGDLSVAPTPMKKVGWATGYALSIYGTEYKAQCPFRTGNGYGDGRAIFVFEGVFNGRRLEMQLKGGGTTPYCRGGDGRAVLRSSVREFLAQEYMHALGIPTSRSLTLYVSKSETVSRPWYSEGSRSVNPDIMMENPVAISTRVAPSFLRVGQLELFLAELAKMDHPEAMEELHQIVSHLIEREYKNEIDENLVFQKQIVELARLFQRRLTNLVANWIRVGYCQGNFNSDNCAAGGFTLDYGPFGFNEVFDPRFQPWTGGGEHFSFFNQPNAAEANYHMFYTAIRPLLAEGSPELAKLDKIRSEFADVMQLALKKMWSEKLGLISFDGELFTSLMHLMIESQVDYTIFFRELSHLPEGLERLKKSFYQEVSAELQGKWQAWLKSWREQVVAQNGDGLDEVSRRMKRINPKYAWREWQVVPAYINATKGDYSRVRELQEVFSHPYDEQSEEIESKYYRLKPKELINVGGISHYSCSS